MASSASAARRVRGSPRRSRAPRQARVAAAAAAVAPPKGSTVLVAGATGGVGQLAAAKLLDRGYAVRALVRDAEKARAVLGDGVECVVADMRDVAALEASGAAAGVSAVVCATGTTAFPSKRWDGDNGPEQTDYVSVGNLVRCVAEQSPGVGRFVLVSSVGVTRQGEFPYVVLNLFGVLKWKAAGEQVLRESGLPYTLLRPGRLTDGPYTSYDLNTLLQATSGTKRAVQLATGDSLTPEATSRLVVAEAAVQSLALPCTLGEAFELGSTEGEGPGDDAASWEALFAGALSAGSGA